MAFRLLNSTLNDLAILLMRMMLAVVFIFHGSQKLFGLFDGPGLPGFTAILNEFQVPAPAYATVLVGATEFFGGIALLLGAWARIAVVPLIVTMLVASFVVHRDAFSMQAGGMEYTLTLAIVLLGIGMMGPGKFSLGTFLAAKPVVLGEGQAQTAQVDSAVWRELLDPHASRLVR